MQSIPDLQFGCPTAGLQIKTHQIWNMSCSFLISVARGVGPSVVIGAPAAENAFTAVRQMQERYFDTGRNAPALEFITPVTGPNLPQICVAVGTGTMTPLEGAEEYDNDVRNQALQLQLPGWD